MMRKRAHKLLWTTVAIAIASLPGCTNETVLQPGDKLAPGTWGGKDAGLIVDDTTAHLHVGCTFGNFSADVTPDASGHFSVAGEYVLQAYPIQIGPTLPAQFAGLLENNKLTLLVTVHDTVSNQVVIKGPVTVTFGREPQLGPCPICVKPRPIAPD